ncbi:MAG: HEAT repeat domain-containing protein [Alphaproteobacteria bacterium]|nr:HEAT repeat domain-containing protein [Alphaproteobacteria bacterium]
MIEKFSSHPDLASQDLNQLIERALKARLHTFGSGADARFLPPLGWEAMDELYRRADPLTLAAAILLCKSADVRRRELGAAVLGHLGWSSRHPCGLFQEERYRALEEFLATEMAQAAVPSVLSGICSALGYLNDPRAIPLVLPLIDHSCAAVRHGVLIALSRHTDEAATDGLIRLMDDPDSSVREYATSSFGGYKQCATDSTSIRAALHARLSDTCDAIRHSAIGALALRKDKTALPFLEQELAGHVSVSLFEAARNLADPSLWPALMQAKERMSRARREDERLTPDRKRSWLSAMAACGCPMEPGIPDLGQQAPPASSEGTEPLAEKSSDEPDLSSLDLDQLIEKALGYGPDKFLDGVDPLKMPSLDHDAISAICRLSDAATLAAATDLSKSADIRRRKLAARVLGGLGGSHDNPGGVFAEERYRILAGFLATEIAVTPTSGVVWTICKALGDLKDPRGTALVLGLIDHSSSDVRFAVTLALSYNCDQATIEGMIRLTADPCSEVRKSATSNFRRIDADSPTIRSALQARLADDFLCIRHMAIAALAQRKDHSILPLLERELGGEVTHYLFDAATHLPDATLCPVLRTARGRMSGLAFEDEKMKSLFDDSWLEAMAACGCSRDAGTPDPEPVRPQPREPRPLAPGALEPLASKP